MKERRLESFAILNQSANQAGVVGVTGHRFVRRQGMGLHRQRLGLCADPRCDRDRGADDDQARQSDGGREKLPHNFNSLVFLSRFP
jgi:hypothetical protein